jgi:ankyrin repeat protein
MAIKQWSGHSRYSQEVPKQITGLHLAAYFGVEGIVRLLLHRGADVKAAATDGETPLHRASYNGHLEVVQLLLDKGADVKAATEDGETPLY